MSNDMKTFGSGDVSPDDVRNRNITIALMMLCGIVTLPIVVITSALMWFLVSSIRIAPKVIYGSYGIFFGLSLITGFGWWGVNLFVQFFQDFMYWISTDFSGSGLIGQLFKFYLYQAPVALLLGGLIGCIYTAIRMFFRDKWTEIEFRLTPFEILAKKRNIKEIQNDENSPDSGRTLGIDKKGNRIIQTADEARAHTLVLGASGTGKALCVNTPIMTTEGFKRMGDIDTGDIVFNENMKRVEVVGAFDTEKAKPSYTFTFSNGEQITSDLEHLWTIHTGETLNTAQIIERMEAGETVSIKSPERRPLLMDNTSSHYTTDPFIAGSYLQIQSGMNLYGGVQGPQLSAEWLNKGYRLIQDAQGRYVPDEKSAQKLQNVTPESYLNAPVPVRESFLSGVIRTGGFLVEPSEHDSIHQIFGYENNHNPDMVTTVLSFALSLGENTHKHENTVIFQASNHYANNKQMDRRGAYSDMLRELKKNKEEYTILSYDYTLADVRCIKVDSQEGLYLAGHMGVPTHNTTTLMLMARDSVKQGHGFIMVDVKGGPDVPEFIKEYAERYGRRMYHWSMHDIYLKYKGPADKPAFYDPITRGDPSRKKDLILSLRKWNDASDVYKSATASYLQTLFNVTRLSPPDADVDTLTDVIGLMQSSQHMLTRLDSVPPNRRNEDYQRTRTAVLSMIQNNDKLQKESIKTTQQTLQIFSQSIAGPWLGNDPDGDENINLWDVANRGDVVVFSLDSSNYPELSQNIANLIIQDLKTASSEFRSDPPENTLDVFIDEFSAIESDNLVQLVNKCRDANIPVVFSTQTIADMQTVSDTFADQLNGIISSFIVHRVNSDNEAKTYSGIFGVEDKAEVMQEVEHTSGFGKIGFGAATGKGRLTYKEDYIIPFKKLQSLSRGEMFYHSKAGNKKDKSGRIESVTVIPEPGYIVQKDTKGRVSESTKNRYASLEGNDTSMDWRNANPTNEELEEDLLEDTPVDSFSDYDFEGNEPLESISVKGKGLQDILNLRILGKESDKAKSLILSHEVEEEETPSSVASPHVEEENTFQEPEEEPIEEEPEEALEKAPVSRPAPPVKPQRKKRVPAASPLETHVEETTETKAKESTTLPKRPNRYDSLPTRPSVRKNPEDKGTKRTVRATQTPVRPQRPQVRPTRPQTAPPPRPEADKEQPVKKAPENADETIKSAPKRTPRPRGQGIPPVPKKPSPNRVHKSNIKPKTTKIQQNSDEIENRYSW